MEIDGWMIGLISRCIDILMNRWEIIGLVVGQVDIWVDGCGWSMDMACGWDG